MYDRPAVPLLAAFLAMALFSGCAFEAGMSRGPIIERELGFRLDPPAADWKLLRASDLRRVVPGASAGAVSAGGLYGYVMVSRKPKVSKGGRAGAAPSRRKMPDSDMESTRFEEVTFRGRPALYGVFTSLKEDEEMRYAYLSVEEAGLEYRLVAVATAGQTSPDGSTFGPFFDAFSFLADAPEAGEGLELGKKTYGVGWWIRSGTFESAVAGVRVAPPSGWSLTRDGAGLIEIGLLHARTATYVALRAETVFGVDRDAVEKELEAGVTDRLDATRVKGSAKVVVDGHPVKLRAYRVTGDFDGEVLYGVFWVESRCVQIIVSYPVATREASRAVMAEAVGAIRFLDEARELELSDKLLARADPEVKMGPTYVLEGGVYRDIANGFSWTKPRGFWRVHAGAHARRTGEDAILYIEEPGRGVEGVVVAEPAPVADGIAFHRLAMERISPAEPGAKRSLPLPLELGDTKALLSTGELDRDGQRFTFLLATALREGSAFQMLFTGLPENMAAADEAVRAAVRAFSFGSSVAPPPRDDGFSPDAPVWM